MNTFDRVLGAVTKYATLVVCALFCLFHLYTSYAGPIAAMEQRLFHLTAGLVLVYLNKPFRDGLKGWWRLLDLLLASIAFTVGLYLYVYADDIAFRLGVAEPADLVAGAIVVLLLLEATRRVLGFALPLIASVALLYGFFGDKLPGMVAHTGFGPDRLISHLSLTTEGIFSIPLAVSSTVVVIFIIFATFLNATGAGQYFVDLVMSYFGRSKGAPAKAAVVGSALMGTLSGSVIANVMGIGTFTIPLMKRSGYRPVVAGGIEACTSTGGQLMPPVMGAAAFIIAEFLRVPYSAVIKAAIIPALLYYAQLFIYVHLEAERSGLKGLPEEEIKQHRSRLKGRHHLFIPIVALVVMMTFLEWSPTKSAFYAAILTLAIGFLQKTNRLTLRHIPDLLRAGGMGMLEVITACATSGIIIGVLSLTGLGLQLSTILTGLAGANLMLLLILTMIVSLILGMGLTTTACYVILAVLVAPAMIRMGIDPMAAHMFVFYYGMYSFITPPVALGAYAAGALAGASPMATGYMAWKIALPGFILPYVFVFYPALLAKGSWQAIAYITCSSLLGIFFVSAAVVGWVARNLAWFERVALLVAGLLLIDGGFATDIAGLLLGGAIVANCVRQARRAAAVQTAPASLAS